MSPSNTARSFFSFSSGASGRFTATKTRQRDQNEKQTGPPEEWDEKKTTSLPEHDRYWNGRDPMHRLLWMWFHEESHGEWCRFLNNAPSKITAACDELLRAGRASNVPVIPRSPQPRPSTSSSRPYPQHEYKVPMGTRSQHPLTNFDGPTMVNLPHQRHSPESSFAEFSRASSPLTSPWTSKSDLNARRAPDVDSKYTVLLKEWADSHRYKVDWTETSPSIMPRTWCVTVTMRIADRTHSLYMQSANRKVAKHGASKLMCERFGLDLY